MIKDINHYKIVQRLKEMGLLDEQGSLLPSAKEAAMDALQIVGLLFLIPTVAAILTTAAILLGVSSGMVLWWLLFV
jgi:hypothetical protein